MMVDFSLVIHPCLSLRSTFVVATLSTRLACCAIIRAGAHFVATCTSAPHTNIHTACVVCSTPPRDAGRWPMMTVTQEASRRNFTLEFAGRRGRLRGV